MDAPYPNAVKHGALPAATGKIFVQWKTAEVEGTPWPVFDWNEELAAGRSAPGRVCRPNAPRLRHGIDRGQGAL